MITAVEAQTRASSSTARMYERASSPEPPYSSGTIIPRIPISPSLPTISRGNVSFRSRSATPGAISCSANSRTALRMRAWSSEISKFMRSGRAGRFRLPSRGRGGGGGRRAGRRRGRGRLGGRERGLRRTGRRLPSRRGCSPRSASRLVGRRRGPGPPLSSAPAPAPPALLTTRFGRVHPPLLEVSERDDDLRTVRPRSQVLDDPAPEVARRISGEHRDPLRIEKDHARPRDALLAAVCRGEVHHEEVPLVVEKVRDVLELRRRFDADRLQEVEILLAPLERLLHRDDPVTKHACLRHRFSRSPIRSPVRRL